MFWYYEYFQALLQIENWEKCLLIIKSVLGEKCKLLVHLTKWIFEHFFLSRFAEH